MKKSYIKLTELPLHFKDDRTYQLKTHQKYNYKSINMVALSLSQMNKIKKLWHRLDAWTRRRLDLSVLICAMGIGSVVQSLTLIFLKYNLSYLSLALLMVFAMLTLSAVFTAILTRMGIQPKHPLRLSMVDGIPLGGFLTLFAFAIIDPRFLPAVLNLS